MVLSILTVITIILGAATFSAIFIDIILVGPSRFHEYPHIQRFVLGTAFLFSITWFLSNFVF